MKYKNRQIHSDSFSAPYVLRWLVMSSAKLLKNSAEAQSSKTYEEIVSYLQKSLQHHPRSYLLVGPEATPEGPCQLLPIIVQDQG